MEKTAIKNLVSYLYSTGWVKTAVNNIAKKLNRDKKQDLEQYIYLYILEHTSYFIRDNQLKPITEIQYYLITAIKNQYKDTFRKSSKEIVNSDYIELLSNYK